MKEVRDDKPGGGERGAIVTFDDALVELFARIAIRAFANAYKAGR